MDCLSANCSVTGNDRMISCWLCMGNYHLKCTALRARDADALLDPLKSLHWTCSACKKINADFYKFFKGYKGEFDKLNNDFLSLQSKLAMFGELFNSFPSLDKFVETSVTNSPKTKGKSSKLLEVPVLNNSSLSTPNISETVTVTGSTPSTSKNTVCSPQLNVIGNGTDNTLDPPINTVTTDTRIIPKPLQAVPPRKTVFVSRLASNTSSDDINFYIKSKLGRKVDILVQKFKFSTPRSISSFKISVTDNEYNHIIDPNFWPEYTLVREYTFRERTGNNYDMNIVRLPSGNFPASKN